VKVTLTQTIPTSYKEAAVWNMNWIGLKKEEEDNSKATTMAVVETPSLEVIETATTTIVTVKIQQ